MYTLLAMHAHPDDESSKGPGTVAHYVQRGVRAVLVTATGGEAGDILNPALDLPEVHENLTEFRRKELQQAIGIIGYDKLIELGYRDSGMPDSEDNANPAAFTNADYDEVLARMVAIVRQERPQVVLGYDSHERYPHPDHLMIHRLTCDILDAAADQERFPDAGDPWSISRIVAPMFSIRRVMAIHEAAIDAGLVSPYAHWIDKLDPDADVNKHVVRINIADHIETARNALRAHATQIDPKGRWFSMPTEMIADVYPFEDFEVLAAPVPFPDGATDLFEGL